MTIPTREAVNANRKLFLKLCTNARDLNTLINHWRLNPCNGRENGIRTVEGGDNDEYKGKKNEEQCQYGDEGDESVFIHPFLLVGLLCLPAG